MIKLKKGFIFVSLIGAVIVLSLLSSSIWGERPERVMTLSKLVTAPGMTVRDFAASNGLTESMSRHIFGVADREDFDRNIETFGLSEQELLKKTNRAVSLGQEYESKNWVKIPLKFTVWTLFLAGVFIVFKKKRLSARIRVALYLAAILIFGIIFGSDPSPMGTVKDAIVLFGKSGAVFPPRMIALTVFILMTVVANKFICSWGCQFGVLQDAVFRINRDARDIAGIFRQVKMPFVVSNAIRILFFVAFSSAAIIIAFDVVEIIDPFKLFKPAMVGIGGGLFLAGVIIASLFVYRPWCHLFCPFGLVSWVFEKISINKISVDYDSCISCEKCAKACPSNVMSAILRRDKIIPDCFTCGTCINACPTGSISLKAGRRPVPPAGKFS